MAALRRLFAFMATINFTVGAVGAPADGTASYYNPILSGKKIKVFREGLYQYKSGINFIIAPGSGSILFFPVFYFGERIRIQTI
jgi:hypothetical protein